MLKNKIIKLLVGTNNKGKLREIKDLLPKNLEIYSPKDFPFSTGLLILKSDVEKISRFLGNKSLISFDFPLLFVPINNFIIFFFNI